MTKIIQIQKTSLSPSCQGDCGVPRSWPLQVHDRRPALPRNPIQGPLPQGEETPDATIDLFLLLTLTILSGNRGTPHAALHCRDQVRALHSSRGSRRAVHDRPVRRGGGGRRGQEAHQPCNRGRSFQPRGVAGIEDNRKMSIDWRLCMTIVF